MNVYRFSKGVTAQTNSFEGLRPLFGLPPLDKKKKQEKEKQKKFLSRFRCKACNEPMTFMGGNVVCCTNEKCRGIKIERKDDDGNVFITYKPSFLLLNENKEKYASKIFND